MNAYIYKIELDLKFITILLMYLVIYIYNQINLNTLI